MRNKTLLLACLILAGCVPSWNPLYTEKDIVFDAALVGTWMAVDAKEGSKETWVFAKAGDKLYQLQQTDEEGRKATFEVRLVKLKDHRFLDLYLAKIDEDDVKMNGWAAFSLAPAHLILKVHQIEPNLKIAAMNPEHMKELLKKTPGAIAHRVIFDENIVLNASTAELQKFVVEHVDEEEFFGGPMELKRKAASGLKQ
jgi:hypothetical protein